MWLGFLPSPPHHLEIHIFYDKSVIVEGIKIWNYNKGILDCTKGVQQLQILLNQELKWEGKLEPGKGIIDQDYSKKIKFNPAFNFVIDESVKAARDILSKEPVKETKTETKIV